MEDTVYAIEGATNNRTINLTGLKGKREFTNLIDGGCTHSFID